MIRIFLTILVPLLLPLAAYLVWVWFAASEREAEAEGRNIPAWHQWPWVWLVSAGAVLAVVTLLVFGTIGMTPPDSEYRPARYENGTLIPGEFIPRDKPAQ